MNTQQKLRKDNSLLKEALENQKVIERRNNIIPNKPKSESKLNIRALL